MLLSFKNSLYHLPLPEEVHLEWRRNVFLKPGSAFLQGTANEMLFSLTVLDIETDKYVVQLWIGQKIE